MSDTQKTDLPDPETESTIKDKLCIDFHGAAIIDENGREIPITENMVKQACEKIDPEISWIDKTIISLAVIELAYNRWQRLE